MRKFVRFLLFGLALAAIAALISSVTVRHAVAQTIRAALVKNADEPGRTPYQVFFQGGVGGYTGFVLSTVPANKRLVITNVSLIAFLEPGTSVGYVRLQAYDPTTLHLLSEVGVPYNPNLYPTSPYDSTRRYVVNEPVRLYVEAGQQPRVDIAPYNGSFAGEVTVLITGYMVDLSL